MQPVAPRRQYLVSAHGDTWADPWFWLREQDDPATMEYLHAENAYTDAFLDPLKSLQDTVYEEIRGRIKEDDNTVPEKEGDYYYYVRYEEGGQYPIYCRKHGSEDGAEEILLDVNALAEGHDYTRVGTFENSPDHRLIAYGVDHDGSEQYTIRDGEPRNRRNATGHHIQTPITASNGATITVTFTTRSWTNTTDQ